MENNFNNELKEMFKSFINNVSEVCIKEEKNKINDETLKYSISDLEFFLNNVNMIIDNEEMFTKKEFFSWITVISLTTNKLRDICKELFDKKQKEQIESLMKGENK